MTIGLDDINRLMLEFLNAYEGPDDWCQKFDIDEDDFATWTQHMTAELFEELRQAKEQNLSGREVFVMMNAAFMAAVAVGAEIGRQYPITPFNE